MNVAYDIATEQLRKASIILAAHEAVVDMLRERGDLVGVRSNVARVNGMRVKVARIAAKQKTALATSIYFGSL